MDCVFPTLVKLMVLSSDIVVQDWCFVLALVNLSRVAPVDAVILAWTAHLDHVHHVLGVGVLGLTQVQLFEFLPHRRVLVLGLNVAERAQRLLCDAVFLCMREALVHFNLSQSFLFLQTKFYII